MIKHLENFNPLSPVNLKKDNGSRDKQPEELMMIRAAHAIAQILFAVINIGGDEV